MDRSPGFGPCAHRLPPSSDSVSLRVLAFWLFPLPGRAARRTVLQKVRGHTLSCRAPAGRRHRVSGSLSLPSRGTFHLSFTVLYAIGDWGIFRLGGWSPRLPTGFLVSRATLDPVCFGPLSCTGISPSLSGLSRSFPLAFLLLYDSPNPISVTTNGLGSFPFAHHY